MTAVVLLSCDAVHPDRTPPVCRGYLATRSVTADLAYEEAEEAGWTQTPEGYDRCPSCSRTTP